MHPSMSDEALRHQSGEMRGTANIANTSSRRQAITHNIPSRLNRFVSSSNFVEGHPGFQHTGFEQRSFQQNSFHQTSLPQRSLQQSRTRNMYEGSGSAETGANLREESTKQDQSYTRNMFDGSSSAATPSSQRRDIHGVPYTSSVMPTEPQGGRRMDEEVGSSLADNSDFGSVNYSAGMVFHDTDAAPGMRYTQISTPVTPPRGLLPPTRQPLPPPEEAPTWSASFVHPPQPRYQHQLGMVEDENGRVRMVPEYQYSPGSLMTSREAHDDPVEETMATYIHPRPLPRPVLNPFITPPSFLLGGRRVEDDDLMVGRNDVGWMRSENVGSGDRVSARLAAEEADQTANQANVR